MSLYSWGKGRKKVFFSLYMEILYIYISMLIKSARIIDIIINIGRETKDTKTI